MRLRLRLRLDDESEIEVECEVEIESEISPHSNFDGTEKVQPFCFGSRYTQNGGDQEVCWVNHFFF